MTKGVEAVGGGEQVGARAKRTVLNKRYAAPAVVVVAMDQVPDPPLRFGSVAESLYSQIGKLKAGMALRADFESDAHAEYVKGKIKGLAKKDKQLLGSSRSEDGKARWFWLEKL